MGGVVPKLTDEELGVELVHAAQLIIKHDGDRDEDCKSYMTVEMVLYIAGLCKAAAKRFGADYDEMTFGNSSSPSIQASEGREG